MKESLLNSVSFQMQLPEFEAGRDGVRLCHQPWTILKLPWGRPRWIAFMRLCCCSHLVEPRPCAL